MLKKIIHFSFLFMLLGLFSLSVQAQNTPRVKVSNEKVAIGNRIYYMHTVEAGHTVYSICKAYKVTQEELFAENPSARDGLSIGQRLKIPYRATTPSVSVEPRKHVIAQGENLYRIALKYNVSQEEILSLNPGLSPTNLKIGDTINIPAAPSDFHVVAQGDNLYRISQRYGISQEAIINANPGIDPAALKLGQRIVIPALDVDPDDNVIIHILAQGENIYRLSKKYGVPEEEILAMNPGLSPASLTIGQKIKIPKKREEIVPKVEVVTRIEFKEHKVEKRETIFGICKKYGVVDSLFLAHNKEVKENGLKKGKIVKIPMLVTESVDILPLTDTLAIRDSITTMADTIGDVFYSWETCDSIKHNQEKKTLNVALMLPLFLENTPESITVDPEVENPDQARRDLIQRQFFNGVYRRSLNYLEFYQGVLLALDSLKQAGANIKLYVYDTEASAARVEQLLEGKEFDHMDLILGPISSTNVKLVAKRVHEYQVPIVAPLANDTSITINNPHVFQVNPSLRNGYAPLARYSAQAKPDRLIFIHDTNRLYAQNELEMKGFLRAYLGAEYLADSTKFVEFADTGFLDEENFYFDSVLQKGVENYVIIPREDEVYVSKIMSALNIHASNFKITLLGYPGYTNFRSVDLEYYHKLNFHFYRPFYTDFSDKKTQYFILNYRKYYRANPFRVHHLGFNYAMLGYDLAMHFISAEMNYGQDFCNCIPHISISHLLSHYNFSRTGPYNGFANNTLFIVNYTRDIAIQPVSSITNKVRYLSPQEIEAMKKLQEELGEGTKEKEDSQEESDEVEPEVNDVIDEGIDPEIDSDIP